MQKLLNLFKKNRKNKETKSILLDILQQDKTKRIQELEKDATSQERNIRRLLKFFPDLTFTDPEYFDMYQKHFVSSLVNPFCEDYFWERHSTFNFGGLTESENVKITISLRIHNYVIHNRTPIEVGKIDGEGGTKIHKNWKKILQQNNLSEKLIQKFELENDLDKLDKEEHRCKFCKKTEEELKEKLNKLL